MASYIQWYNENQQRGYPIKETASRTDIAGKRMPDYLLSDLQIMVPTSYSNPYISGIRITPTLLTIGICSGTTGLLVGTYVRDTLEAYKAYALTPVASDVSGWVVFGDRIPATLTDYRFNSHTQSGLESRVIKYVAVLPVTKLLKLNGNALQFVSQLVKLTAGSGVIIALDPLNPQVVLVQLTSDTKHAILGPCNLSPDLNGCGFTPIRSINGVCPDADGKLTLRFE